MSRFIGSITIALLGLSWVGAYVLDLPHQAVVGLAFLTGIAGLMAFLTLR